MTFLEEVKAAVAAEEARLASAEVAQGAEVTDAQVETPASEPTA